MSLRAHTLAAALRLAAEESATLRTFIDDLDGWDDKDCDTGTNAHHTLTYMAAALEDATEYLSFASGLELAIDAGITYGMGHVGQLITLVLASWHRSINGIDTLQPVHIRAMLIADPCEKAGEHGIPERGVDEHSAHGYMELSAAIAAMLDDARDELNALGTTLPAGDDLVNLYAAQTQFALIEATSATTGRIDPGAAIISLLATCLDSALRDDNALLASFAQMLADLAASPTSRPPRAAVPHEQRAFTVDLVLSGVRSDAQALSARLTMLGAAHSWVGRADFFGLGEWRFHIDTSAPLAVYPRTMNVRAFTVTDARPNELIGVDTLSDGVTHRGVRLLERRPMKRVERAHVIALTQAPGLVEYLAQAGATVVLSPTADDVPIIAALARASSTGVSLILPYDEASAELAATACTYAEQHHMSAKETHTDAQALRIIAGQSRCDLVALALVQACGTIFVPQPGGSQVAAQVESLLRDAQQHALASQRTVLLPSHADHEVIAAVEEIGTMEPRQWRILLGGNDGTNVVALVNQLLSAYPGTILDVIDGGFTAPSQLQGLL